MAAITAKPPITPPTMAPTGLVELDVEAATADDVAAAELDVDAAANPDDDVVADEVVELDVLVEVVATVWFIAT